jgi:hypothetical protein
MNPRPRSGGPPPSLSRETSAAAYRADAALLATVVALALAITFAPYIFAAKTLLSSAAEVPSLYVSGARYDTYRLSLAVIAEGGYRLARADRRGSAHGHA